MRNDSQNSTKSILSTFHAIKKIRFLINKTFIVSKPIFVLRLCPIQAEDRSLIDLTLSIPSFLFSYVAFLRQFTRSHQLPCTHVKIATPPS